MVLSERDRDSSKAISYPESSCFFGQRESTQRVRTLSRTIESIIKATMYRNNISVGKYGYLR